MRLKPFLVLIGLAAALGLLVGSLSSAPSPEHAQASPDSAKSSP